MLYQSSPMPSNRTGTAIEITRARAGWRYVHFAVRHIAPARAWIHNTGAEECCLVLLSGHCTIFFDDRAEVLGPRPSVFAGYPHAIYLPPRTAFRVVASEPTELADGRAPARTRLAAQVIRPDQCGYEIRGGGNATRQIVDIIPPGFPADRLLVCEVFTPSGNWSSYPPHKHDVDAPPGEADLDEIYYYRFRDPDGYGFQRLYTRRRDDTVRVTHGDVVAVREGYHPFVTAYGYDAYYLNVLAGSRRSMAASDDPRHAHFRRTWPPPDPRLPMIER